MVATRRPVRRIVLVNAVLPSPGKSFSEANDFDDVFRTRFSRFLARRAPGMNEVYPNEPLPDVEYVYICGELDDAIQPEWEQRVATERLHVRPVVIRGAHHSDIATAFAAETVDAAVVGLAPSMPATPFTAGAERVRPSAVNRPPISWISLVISAVVPLIVYFLVRSRTADDTTALAIAWLIPVAWTLFNSVRRRRVDPIGMIAVVGYGIALTVTVWFGTGDLPLKLHHGVVVGILGFICLGSIVVRRPILVLIVRRRITAVASRAGGGSVVLGEKLTQRLTIATFVLGMLAVANSALQVVLAFALSTGDFLLATTILHGLTIVLVLGTLYFTLRRSV
jgi:hypothetical protein